MENGVDELDEDVAPAAGLSGYRTPEVLGLAAFALAVAALGTIPLLLGLEAVRLLLEDDPLWVSAVTRGAVVLAVVVVVLRLATWWCSRCPRAASTSASRSAGAADVGQAGA